MSAVGKLPVRRSFGAVVSALVAVFCWTAVAAADGSGDPAAVKDDDGKHFDKEGNPTYKVGADGMVDWYTYSGFRRYHSDCHVCHGPDGMGSSYAPALKDSLKALNYSDFVGVVAGGRKNVNSAQENVMPEFGTNANVMCYLDDIFVYLRARTNDAVGRGRPAKHEEKPAAASAAENTCFGTKQ
jgi:methanol metabolism-related c-type cytochrome